MLGQDIFKVFDFVGFIGILYKLIAAIKVEESIFDDPDFVKLIKIGA